MSGPAPFRCVGSCVGQHSPECDAAWRLHMDHLLRQRELRELCHRYNDATNPAAFRCEDEHKRCTELARQLRADLRRRFREGIDYRETESGRFLPMA